MSQIFVSIKERLRNSVKVAVFHFLVSLTIAGLLSFLVFQIWFPYPYREIVGGRNLFWLVIIVDIFCGPFLTSIVFDIKKSRKELTLDLGLIFLIQLCALAYGLYSLWQVRPIYLAFEVDRFQVVTYADIKTEDLQPDIHPLHRLSWRGIQLIGTRERVIGDGEDLFASLELSMQGYAPAFRPTHWENYQGDLVKKRAHAVSRIINKKPEYSKLIRDEISKAKKMEDDVLWLPVTSFYSLEWIVLLDEKTMQPFAFLPIDGFL